MRGEMMVVAWNVALDDGLNVKLRRWTSCAVLLHMQLRPPTE